MAEPLTPETFQPHIDKLFRVKDWQHALTLTSVEIRHLLPHERAVLQHQAFTLIFRGPPGEVLPDGLYTLEAEGGPAFELYVIPIQTMSRDRQDYQVVFN